MQHSESGAINVIPSDDPDPIGTMRAMARAETGEDLWAWYQLDQRMNGPHAPSNFYLRAEIERRLAL
jgi:hypothetical protein